MIAVLNVLKKLPITREVTPKFTNELGNYMYQTFNQGHNYIAFSEWLD